MVTTAADSRAQQQLRQLQRRLQTAETERNRLQISTSLLEQEFVKTVDDLRASQQTVATLSRLVAELVCVRSPSLLSQLTVCSSSNSSRRRARKDDCSSNPRSVVPTTSLRYASRSKLYLIEFHLLSLDLLLL
jgi:hypothetical protein